MATVKKVLILVVPVIVWGVLYGLGCQKKEDTEKAQKEQLTPIRPSMDEPASLGNKQIPSDMEGKFPKEMLRALQKSGLTPHNLYAVFCLSVVWINFCVCSILRIKR